ncbi:MAG TPA: nucleotidyltransferase domain-containing protein [Solirubrobacter sp.]|nr:nucleotidyltransferase domain-containing protein [Solirubrobacter sp.]
MSSAFGREHLGAPAVLALTDMRSQLWQRLRNLLAEWEVPAVHASVFGSAARADGDAASDIDIFLVRPADIDEADPGWADRVDGLRSLVARWTGNEASIVEQSEQSLDELLARPQAPPVLRDGIDLAGAPVRQLLGRVHGA